jgi:lipoprotein-anchoring transpeptidase ErfK/SrfK
MSRSRVLVVFLLAVALSAVGSLAWADRRSAERLADGVRVAGVEVGGLTNDEAMERVWQSLRPQAMRDIRVTAAGQSHVLTAEQAGVRLRLPSAVRRAYTVSRRGTFLTRGWRQLTGSALDHEVSAQPVASRRAVHRFVEEIAEALHRPAQDARLSIRVDRVAISRERAGRRLAEPQALERAIMRALVEPGASRAVAAKVQRIPPKITRDDLRRQTPVVVTVSRSGRRARVFRHGELQASYRVAVGQPGHPTPLGRFAVQTMQKNPVWQVPNSDWAGDLAGKTIPAGDPRNPLIARWIGFDGAVGFHGTESLDSLGRAASRGCVRLSRKDVVSLFEQVRVGTPVLVAR